MQADVQVRSSLNVPRRQVVDHVESVVRAGGGVLEEYCS